jgi:hypothetical protein
MIAVLLSGQLISVRVGPAEVSKAPAEHVVGAVCKDSQALKDASLIAQAALRLVAGSPALVH